MTLTSRANLRRQLREELERSAMVLHTGVNQVAEGEGVVLRTIVLQPLHHCAQRCLIFDLVGAPARAGHRRFSMVKRGLVTFYNSN